MMYKLVGREVVLCSDPVEWARAFGSADRHVADDSVGDARISTVFVGIDQRFDGKGAPLVFESMVFGGPSDGQMERYATWEEAERGHTKMCARVLARSKRVPLRRPKGESNA